MTETATAPAAAAPAPAPVSAPAAPTTAPSTAPAPVTAPVASQPTTAVDASKFTNNLEGYAAALLNEKMAAIPAATEETPVAEPVAELQPATPPEVAPPAEPPAEETAPAAEVAEEKPEFDFNPPATLTPESLTKMVTDNPDFGKLLEADPKLKGQIYKTAREAAELAPYKAYFPDLDSVKDAVASVRDFNGVREAFMGSTTMDGTKATLAKMMELSYERDDDGNVIQENGKPVVGADFYGFLDNVVAIESNSKMAEVKARFEANQYHLSGKYKTQEECDAAYALDKARLQVYEADMNEDGPQAQASADLPEHVRQALSDVERRENALREQQQGSKVQERATYEKGVVTAAQERMTSAIASAIASAKKQGGVMSPYLERVLPQSIGDALMKKIKGDEGLISRQLELQRLPATKKSHDRRVAEVDRAIQNYLPDIVIAEFAAAGIQLVNASHAKATKVKEQIAKTNATEPKGTQSPARGSTGESMGSSAAFDHAQAEWQKANPGKPFDKVAREQILPRVLNLMLSKSA